MTDSLRVAAARNNADWCAAVCRSHGILGTVGDMAWTCARRTPVYYPDAVTLHRDATPADILPAIDTSSGCSVKDSFGTLDLVPDGFVELFDAEWILRRSDVPVPTAPDLRTEYVRSASQLRAWQAAWHGDIDPPDIFRPALLDDRSILVLAMHEGDARAGGAVLSHSAGVVGLSNIFAVDTADRTAVWSAAVTVAVNAFPGVPIVGYQGGDGLVPALENGFTTLGPLRIWLHDS